MDKVKLQEMVKEEVQNLLSEAVSPAVRIQSVIRRLKRADPESKTYKEAVNAAVKELESISNELEGR
jgi:hypothetical protein